MEKENTNQEQNVQEPNGEAQTDGNEQNQEQNQQQNNEEVKIPKSRFDEINNKYKDAQTRITELETSIEKSKDLPNQLETANQKIEAMEAVLNSMLETKMSEINEQFHDLIPSGMDSIQKLDWISKAQEKGLFGKKEEEIHEPLGGGSNPNNDQKVDTSNMSAMDKLRMGFGKKK